MDSIDMKKLETAITYMDRIANGKNPINNLPVEDDSVINNVNVIRCMYFVKEILEEVKKNGGQIGKKARKKDKLDYPIDLAKNFTYTEDKSITKFVKQLNEEIDENLYKKLKYNQITSWLFSNGYLQDEENSERNKSFRRPTQKGIQIGIRTERNSFNGREYMAVIYGKQAQEFIVQNLDNILHEREAE